MPARIPWNIREAIVPRDNSRADDSMNMSTTIFAAAGCAGYPAPRNAVLGAREGAMD